MAKQDNDRKDQLALDERRRTFVKSSVLLGTGTAAAGALPSAAVASIDTKSAPEPKQKGYQVTQHVIDYYKSASN